MPDPTPAQIARVNASLQRHAAEVRAERAERRK